jgi:hypothetical protein
MRCRRRDLPNTFDGIREPKHNGITAILRRLCELTQIVVSAFKAHRFGCFVYLAAVQVPNEAQFICSAVREAQ